VQIHASAEEIGYFENIKRPSHARRFDYVNLAESKAAAYRKMHGGRKRAEVPGSNDGEHPFRLSDAEVASGHVTVEKSPQYTTYRTVNRTAAAMHAMLPSARLIIILRDPIKRAYSGYRQNCLKRRLPDFLLPPDKQGVYTKVDRDRNVTTLCNPKHFDAMVDVIFARMKLKANQSWRKKSEPCAGAGCSVLLAGLYSTFLDAYTSTNRYKRDQLLIVLSENLVSHTIRGMKQIMLHIFSGDASTAKIAQPSVWSQAYQNAAGFTVLPDAPSKSNNDGSVYDPMLPETAAKLQSFYSGSNTKLRKHFPEITWPADSYATEIVECP
jgi:hypothetical protein